MPLPPLTAGDLVLDPRRHRVRRGGRELVLGTREFAILEFLLRRRGQTVSRQEIIEHVWAGDVPRSPRLVDVHVRRLRAQMDDHFPTKLLRTIRGAGYMLESD